LNHDVLLLFERLAPGGTNSARPWNVNANFAGEKGTSVYKDRMPADGTSTARWSNRTSALPIERADRERLDDLLNGFNVSNWRIAHLRAAAAAWLKSQSVSCVGSTLSRRSGHVRFPPIAPKFMHSGSTTWNGNRV